jgi:4-methylaminobutanoate oxidase (formaldehyde-forming)
LSVQRKLWVCFTPIIILIVKKPPHAACGARRSISHLAEKGAVFGELAGWERANWFADEGQERDYEYSWKRQNWFENAAREHRAIRSTVGMYDMSSFGKIRVEGRDAEAFLNYVCGADLSGPVGKITYTQFLNKAAGIEADVTVTRLSETAYLVVTPAATRLADETWLRRHMGEHNVVITDVTCIRRRFGGNGAKCAGLDASGVAQ